MAVNVLRISTATARPEGQKQRGSSCSNRRKARANRSTTGQGIYGDKYVLKPNKITQVVKK